MNGGQQTDASLTKFFLGSSNLGPNLHLGAQTPEPGKKTLFFPNPWGIAFTTQKGSGVGYAIAAGSDLLVKINIAADGTLFFTGGPTTTRYIDLNDPADPATSGDNAGKNPQGIVITEDGKTAYVANFVSRNVSVVNLGTDEQGYPDNGLAGTGQQAGSGFGRRRDVLFLARPFQSAAGHDDFGG